VQADERVRYEGFHHGASYLEHLDFLDCIRNARPPKVTASDGLLAVAVGLAAHRSIDTKLPVELAELS
jgi:predicted dehydrogenase